MLINFNIVKSASADAILDLYIAAGWWKKKTANPKIIPKIIKGSFAFAVAKNKNGKIVAMGRVISDGVNDAYIQDIVVLKRYRNKGIASGLVKLLAKHCVSKKIKWIGLVAEPGANSLYKKIGFKELKNFQAMLFKGEKQ